MEDLKNRFNSEILCQFFFSILPKLQKPNSECRWSLINKFQFKKDTKTNLNIQDINIIQANVCIKQEKGTLQELPYLTFLMRKNYLSLCGENGNPRMLMPLSLFRVPRHLSVAMTFANYLFIYYKIINQFYVNNIFFYFLFDKQ